MAGPKRDITLRQMLPNAMTLGAIAAGLTALRMAFADRLEMAILLILLAAILDGLDGRVARVLGSESPLGAELDSLADLVNFGVVPAFVMGVWALLGVPVLGWGAALFYVIACALRLARFNVGKKSGTDRDPRFFTGVPTPAGAMLALSPFVLAQVWPAATPAGWMSALWLIFCGTLMISRLPSFSMKMRIPRAWGRPAILVLALAFGGAVFWPWETLLAVNLAYLASIPAAGWLKLRSPLVVEGTEEAVVPTSVSGQ